MEPEKKTNGAVIGLIVIIIILIAGSVYMWQTSQTTVEKTIPEELEGDTSENFSDFDSLEADLQTTDTSTGVDANAVY